MQRHTCRKLLKNKDFYNIKSKVCVYAHHSYEWGYTFGAPQAISPVNRIRRVLDYAVTVIPRRKILLGISNYAYDWTLPWKQGTAARLLTNAGAVELAVSRGAEIRYDPRAQAPWFRYTDGEGRAHVVWFEDARSVLPNSLKTEFICTMNLREWRHFFALRCAKAAHPAMREIALPLQEAFREMLPELF